MNTCLGDLVILLEEDFKEFSSAQLFPFFPERLTTSFQIRNDREGDLLFSIISPDPFTVQGASIDPVRKPRRKSMESITPQVAVCEDDDIYPTPVEFTVQFSNTQAALEL